MTHRWRYRRAPPLFFPFPLAVFSVWRMLPGLAQHITTEYTADIRNRTPRARVSLHVQKPKPQASLKKYMKKLHELFDVYNIIHKKTGLRQLRWQCHRRHQQNPQPCPDGVFSTREETKKSLLNHVRKDEE